MRAQTETLSSVITKIKNFVKDKTGVTIYVWDIDDTLFTSNAKILLFKGNEMVAELSTEEYPSFQHCPQNSVFRNYKKSDLVPDFRQFTDPVFFSKTAKPTNLLERFARSQFTEKHNFFIVLTARSNMIIKNDGSPVTILTSDNAKSTEDKTDANSAKNIFLAKFKQHSLDLNTSRSHLIRMGSLSIEKSQPQYDKGLVLQQILTALKGDIGKIKQISFWDDSIHEIQRVAKIAKNFKNIVFTTNQSIGRGVSHSSTNYNLTRKSSEIYNSKTHSIIDGLNRAKGFIDKGETWIWAKIIDLNRLKPLTKEQITQMEKLAEQARKKGDYFTGSRFGSKTKSYSVEEAIKLSKNVSPIKLSLLPDSFVADQVKNWWQGITQRAINSATNSGPNSMTYPILVAKNN